MASPRPSISIVRVSPREPALRLVRRRGVGHPDALCDAVAEAVALALARHCREHFGDIPPLAVTRVTLTAGDATPRFGGGAVHAPMHLHLAGHAVHRLHSVPLPVQDIAVGATRRWLREHLHAADAERHARIHCEFRELAFERSACAGTARATEPLWGDAHAPRHRLEALAACAEQAINRASTRTSDPVLGEDVEVLATQDAGGPRIRAWCRFVDAHVPGDEALTRARARAGELIAAALADDATRVSVNDGPDGAPVAGELTVTGTRAEAMRDGASGCSQGVNGVLAPDGPATGLAIAGSDVVRDPRRACQIGAELLAAAIVRENPAVTAARCRLLLLPGDRLYEDTRVSVRLGLAGTGVPPALRAAVREQVADGLRRLPQLWRELCGNAVSIDDWPLDRPEPDALLDDGLYGEPRAGMLRAIRASALACGAQTGCPVLDPRVLDAIERVPRHLFVPPELRGQAYLDRPLPIGDGQTISQPFIVALMTQLAELAPGARVLEVGTGSGYQTAVLAELAGEVCSIERIPALHERARRTLHRLGHGNVRLALGDGRDGWTGEGGFDAVLVTAAAERVPAALLGQCRPGGRLVAPLGAAGDQVLVVVTRNDDGSATRRPVLPVAFVPLLRGVDA